MFSTSLFVESATYVIGICSSHNSI